MKWLRSHTRDQVMNVEWQVLLSLGWWQRGACSESRSWMDGGAEGSTPSSLSFEIPTRTRSGCWQNPCAPLHQSPKMKLTLKRKKSTNLEVRRVWLFFFLSVFILLVFASLFKFFLPTSWSYALTSQGALLRRSITLSKELWRKQRIPDQLSDSSSGAYLLMLRSDLAITLPWTERWGPSITEVCC